MKGQLIEPVRLCMYVGEVTGWVDNPSAECVQQGLGIHAIMKHTYVRKGMHVHSRPLIALKISPYDVCNGCAHVCIHTCARVRVPIGGLVHTPYTLVHKYVRKRVHIHIYGGLTHDVCPAKVAAMH